MNTCDSFRVANFDFFVSAWCLQYVTTGYCTVPYTLPLYLKVHLWEFCTIFSRFSEMLLCVLLYISNEYVHN